MITIAKLKEYEAHEGNDDDYTRIGGFRKNIIAGKEWSLIARLTGEFKLVARNLASNEYAETINKEIVENCHDIKTVDYLKRISEKPW